ncbi:hypothetical protein GDO81_012458 [Engystomops pustulosus]|uniref:Uncharacterized protein n=1 Tax=Engystomops pustulosus TaxID=76066 RepID=A0AAV7BMJ6_ENGPU|nr:hypothetical protein GDO81_012458 [Engystomops pustulosus]
MGSGLWAEVSVLSHESARVCITSPVLLLQWSNFLGFYLVGRSSNVTIFVFYSVHYTETNVLCSFVYRVGGDPFLLPSWAPPLV